ncbi:PQQ-binding-like beta-propeller repeat protein [Bremerella sp.]|uniref:outer membrane protein assembly factor BamB family protein n=1 Tax=Bremerella sp. TaxID=2795602 RepID=UPI003919A490
MSPIRLIPMLALAIILPAANITSAEDLTDWPKWRGPNDTGSSALVGLPLEWDADNVLWKRELDGKGCSTPIVWQNTIYVTAPIDGKDALIALDANGKPLWDVQFGSENPGKHRNGSGCNASPTTDGKHVFVYFKSGTLAAVDFEGKITWQTNLVKRYGPDTLFWDHGTSPVLTRDFVVMARMHDGESWLAAFDKATGDLAWKVARNYETPVECDHGYSTPVVIDFQGNESLLTWGGEHLTIHHAKTGDLVWSCGGFNPEGNKLWPTIATPVVVGNVAVIAYGRNDRGTPRLHGVRLDGTGDVTETNRLWDRDDIGTFVPSPAVYQEKVYLVGDKGKVTCFEPATGKTKWEGAFPKHRAHYYGSPLVAGGTLYAPREDGTILVADIRDGFKMLGENDMRESVIASPVPSPDRLLIRGTESLFCIGK